MRVRIALLLLMAACAFHPSVSAQEPGTRISPDFVVAAPDAMPGAVVATVLRVERPEGATAASYTVQAAEQIMIYGAPSGDVALRADAGLVPLTFSVSKETVAGLMHVARVEVRWTDGSTWTADVETRVGVRRGLEISLDTTSAFIARGTTAHVSLVVRNTGNAADTVHLAVLKPEQWTIHAPPALVVPAGGSSRDSVRIRVPPSATFGETQILRVTAHGKGSEAARNLSVTVAERDVEEDGMLRLPATVTVGAIDAGMLEESPVSVALEMQGSLGGGTEASLRVRRSADATTPPAFYRYLTGPSLRAEIRNGQNRVTAGDVLFTASSLHGGSAFGTGVDAGGRLGNVQANVFAARPHQFDAPERPGHMFGMSAELLTGVGAFGVSASDMARPAGIIDETERTRLAALTFRGALAQGLAVRAEAGIMTLRDNAGRTREGVAFDVGSAWHGERLDVQAHVRRVPGSLATSGTAVDETYVSGAFDMGRGITLNGWFVRSEADLLSGSSSRHDGSALTLRWNDGGASAQVSGYLRRTSGGGLLTGDIEQRSVAVGGTLPVGPLTAEGILELGRSSSRDTDAPLRNITSRLSWQTADAFVWAGLTHSEGVFGTDLTRMDAGATARMGRIELDGRVGTWLGDAAMNSMDAWLSSTVHVTPQTAVIAGVDYTPWRVASDEVRVSLGARHSLGVPLPVRRRPDVHGIIYEDANANLRRDPGEAGIRGVRVRRGNTFALTDGEGRYAFHSRHGAGSELSVDAGSLAQGLMLLPTTGTAARGKVDMPVVRAAALQLFVFEDRDRDGVRGMLEPGAPGAIIELTDTHGRTRTASADPRGHVTFAALAPGDYSVRARMATGRQEAGDVTSFTLQAGQATRLEVGAPRLIREIRFGVSTDTVRVDTVTVTAADSATAQPVRSTLPRPRTTQLDHDSGNPPDAAGRPAPGRPDTVPAHMRTRDPQPDSTSSISSGSDGVDGGMITLALGLGSSLLLVTGWVRRRRYHA